MPAQPRHAGDRRGRGDPSVPRRCAGCTRSRAYRALIDDTVHAAWSIDLRWAQRLRRPAMGVLVLETLSQMSSHPPGDEPFQPSCG
jgi:hypothetical protein